MSDTKLLTRIQMLRDDAEVLFWAYYDAAKNKVLLLCDNEYGSKQFDASREDAIKNGAAFLGAVAVMEKRADNGVPLIEYELAPGASEEKMEIAKSTLREKWIEAAIETGTLKPHTASS